MAQEDPSLVVAPLVFPRPVTGHRRLVQIQHPMCGQMSLLTTEVGWSDATNPNYVNYAFTPPSGPKQRGVHSAGPGEITWNLGGDLSNSTMGLLNLMDSNSRGVPFTSIFVQQGSNDSYLFANQNGYSLPWQSFSVSGSQNGAVTFSLEGRSTQLPVASTSEVLLPPPDVPLPAWYTGNDYVTAWSLSHTVNLTPNWVNTPAALPAYYRPGYSEFTIQVTTKVALQEHSLIKFGLGGIGMVEALVTSRNRTFGGRNEPATYQVTTTNVRISDQDVFGPSIEILLLGGPTAAGFG